MANTNITRTPSSTGNRKTFTFSTWFKKTSTGAIGNLFSQYAGSGSGADKHFRVRFNTNDTIGVAAFSTDVLVTNRVFRDTSAWYHLTLAVDTTQATDSNRVKLYINGTQETSFSSTSYPSQNYDYAVNTASYPIRIGADDSDGNGPYGWFNGIMAHVHLTDGTAYAASTFGETDSTSGIWKPKTAPSVTYGTNGFFLKFENSGNLDLDSSGNSRSFSTSGTLTQNVDTPTNNFATGNPIHVDGTGVSEFINGNLTHTNNVSAVSSLAINKGKWYMEFKRQDNGGSITNWMYCGFVKADRTGLRLYRSSNGDYYNGSAYSSYGASWGDGDIVGIALDYDNDTIEFYKNGLSQGSKTSIGICNGDFVLPIWQCSKSSGSPYFHANFGQGYFGTTAVASANADANGHGAMENAVPSVKCA